MACPEHIYFYLSSATDTCQNRLLYDNRRFTHGGFYDIKFSIPFGHYMYTKSIFKNRFKNKIVEIFVEEYFPAVYIFKKFVKI